MKHIKELLDKLKLQKRLHITNAFGGETGCGCMPERCPYAIKAGHLDTVQLLVDHGADKQGALIFAAQRKQSDVVHYVTSKPT